MGEFKLTNLIILINIQLLVDVVISLKKTGARDRYIRGFARANSQITLTAADWTPGSGSSSFSFSLGNAAGNASGNLRKILYSSRTAFFLMYGFVELSSVMTSLARSRDRSLDTKQARPDIAHPASYMFWEFKSFRTMLVVNIRTSVFSLNVCDAHR